MKTYQNTQTIYHRVMTPKGEKYIHELNPGDQIYEYQTGNLLEVEDIAMMEPKECYQISFNDSREMYVSEQDLLYCRGSHPFFHAEHLLHYKSDLVANLHPVEFQGRSVTEHFFDPYLLGVFLIYGGYDDPYINLPISTTDRNPLFSNHGNLKPISNTKNRILHFKWNGRSDEELVRWRELLSPGMKSYIVTKDLNDPILPINEMISHMKHRWKIVQGIFDYGYDPVIFPDFIGIVNDSEIRLREVQKLLWSLGILNQIEYFPDKNNLNKDQYCLKVLDHYDQYPGFFCNPDKIQYLVNIQNHAYKDWNQFELKNTLIKYIGIKSTYNLYTKKPHQIYLLDNYLPRVSL